eukprot:scaffold40854_cov34-Tisochrysis_lutea.AAC.6
MPPAAPTLNAPAPLLQGVQQPMSILGRRVSQTEVSPRSSMPPMGGATRTTGKPTLQRDFRFSSSPALALQRRDEPTSEWAVRVLETALGWCRWDCGHRCRAGMPHVGPALYDIR